MKLRNKKTGEIFEIELIYKSCNLRLPFKTCYGEDVTLSYLNENFEDAKEPLIKDEKIRKAVRAWAEADDVTKVYAYAIGGGEYTELYAQENGVTDGRIRMSIKTQAGIDWGDEYTIAELCGEDEECES